MARTIPFDPDWLHKTPDALSCEQLGLFRRWLQLALGGMSEPDRVRAMILRRVIVAEQARRREAAKARRKTRRAVERALAA